MNGRRLALGRLALPLALWLVVQLPLSAAIITVDGACSLIQAITAANADSSVGGCPAGVGTDEIRLSTDVTLTAVHNSTNGSNGLPSIGTPVIIEGGGHTITRSGPVNFRIFRIASGGQLTLRNTTVSNGTSTGEGGGFLNAGSLTLTNSAVANNYAKYSGGGIHNSSGTLVLTNSTVASNTAGGGSLGAYGAGGGIFNFGGTVVLTNSTLSANLAASYSAGIDSRGGAIFNSSGTTTLTNSTVSGNGAAEGAGVYNSSGTLALTNSLVAQNTLYYGAFDDNCSGSVNDHGGNLADDATCGTIPGTLTGLEPTLADNGGPTKTHALLAGSSAIDTAGDCASIDPVLVADQRGAPRFDGNCDSGAFEFGGCPLIKLMNRTVVTTEVHEECEIHVGPEFAVLGPGGDLTLTGGKQVVFFDEVEIGGTAAIGIDASLQITAALEAAARAGFRVP